MLAAMGVEKDKIRVVFNRVKRSVEDEFPELLNVATELNCFIANPMCMVFENDIYADLADLRLPLSEACEMAHSELQRLKQDLRSVAHDPVKFAYSMKKLNIAKKAENTFMQLDDAFYALLEGAGNAGL